MINGFFHTIQQDLITISGANREQVCDDPQNGRIVRAVIRLAAAVFMGTSILTTAVGISFLAAAPVSAVLKTAVGVSFYALAHDIFLIARRTDEYINNPLNLIGNGTIGLIRDIGNFLTGNSVPIGDGFNRVRTEGTFFQPIWVQFLNRSV